MAEPRKPRVIKTRLGTTGSGTTGAGATGPKAPESTAAPEAAGRKTAAEPGGAGKGAPGKAASGKIAPGNAASGTAPQEHASKAPAAHASADKQPGAHQPGEASGAVRSTSSKVSIVPVPAEPETAQRHRDATRGKAAKAGNRDTLGQSGTLDKLAKLGALAKPFKAGKPGTSHNTGKAGTRQQSGPAATPGPANEARTPDGGAAKGSQTPRVSASGADHGSGATVLTFPVPEFKVRRKRFLYAAGGVVLVVVLVMAVALFSPALAVRTIVFDGQKLVAQETLDDALAPILNKPLPQVTDAEVAQLLSPVIQVKSSYIEARPPSTLVVHVVERIPVALLKTKNGYLLVDQDGVQLGTTSDAATVALPLIDGGTAAIGQDTFQAMTAVLANLPQSILSQLANATAKSPDAVELKLVDGRQVVWGNADDMELKAEVLQALLKAPAPTATAGQEAPAAVKVFDVSAPRHPVTR